MEFNVWCENRGIDLSAISAELRGQLQKRWREEVNADQQAVPYAYPVDAESEIAQQRQRYSSAWGGQRDAAIDATVRAGRLVYSDPRHLEHRLFTDHHNGGPPSYAPGDRGTARQADVLAAALAISGGASPRALERIGVDQRVLDAASDRSVRNVGLHDLIRLRLSETGGHVPSRIDDQAIKEAFAHAGPSTTSIPGILSDAASKISLSSYASTPVIWDQFCKQVPVSDFKQAKLYRLTVAGEILEVPAGGEITHTTLGESDFSVRADQHARMIGIDRKDLINDDLSILSQVPAALARKAALTLERQAFQTLLSNTNSFFGGGNANLAEAGSVLSISGLSLTLRKMAEQTDDDGTPFYIEPVNLIVPPALESMARILIGSAGTVGGDNLVPSDNPHRGRLKVLVAPFIGVSVGLPNASDQAYYVTTGPGDFSPLAVALLNGSGPVVEFSDLDFNRLGMAMRVVFDFGVSYLEPRGAVKATGAGS